MRNLLKEIAYILMVTGIATITACGGVAKDDKGASIFAKSITSFSFESPSVTGTINETNHMITVIVPNGTVVTALKPKIIHTGTSIEPESGVSKNFSSPVTYTVKATDASTQVYTITVTQLSSVTTKNIPLNTASTVLTQVIEKKEEIKEETKVIEKKEETKEEAKVVEKKEQNKDEAAFKIGGQGPAGGIVFYDKGNYSDGWRYLEAASEDQSAIAKWGCYGKSISGATGIAVSTGKSNTKAILENCGETNIAAKLCSAYHGGGKNDWFLPSKDELNLMYTNLKKNGVGGFASVTYWSSSEGTANVAWAQSFSSGYKDDYNKYSTGYVRAVRSF